MLCIIGAGGFGREVAELALDCGFHINELLFVDTLKAGMIINDIPVVSEEDFLSMPNDPFVIGIGDTKVRWELGNKFERLGKIPISLIHPEVTIGRFVKLGKGLVVCSGSRITTNVEIGDYTLLNLNTTIGHDTVIGAACIFSPGCQINGYSSIEARVNCGSGTVTVPHAQIGHDSIIGAGAVVKGSIPPRSVAVGVPAKVIKTL